MSEILIDSKLTLKIPEGGIKINNLLYQLRKFMAELYFGLLRAIFLAVEEKAIAELKARESGRYIKNGHSWNQRQIRTAYGIFHYRFAKVWDKKEKKVITPLPEKIGLPDYCRHIPEAGESGIGLVCHLSYRKSVSEVERIIGTNMGKSSLHRQVQEFSKHMCKWPDLKKKDYRFLMVDGTKIRLLETDRKGHGKKVEMRWALASLKENGKFELVGVWIDKSWEKIRHDLNRRLNYSKLEVLFSDGGPGIEENLLASGMRQQRCTWHGKRDFPYILYADKLKKPQQGSFKDKLKSIPAMNLTQSDLERLKPEDLPKVKELADKTREGFKELLEVLPEEKYPTARTYIDNLSNSVSTFFDFWLANKAWIPLNTNAIESAFSQVKNRIWTIGKRWSENGLMNWLNVVVNKIFFPDSWNKLWSKYLALDSNLQFNLTEVNYRWD